MQVDPWACLWCVHIAGGAVLTDDEVALVADRDAGHLSWGHKLCEDQKDSMMATCERSISLARPDWHQMLSIGDDRVSASAHLQGVVPEGST